MRAADGVVVKPKEIMRLVVQPDDGLDPLIDAIGNARETIDMYVFRLTHPAVEKALTAALERGVTVRTLVAHTNTGGERALRKLELRLLGMGATVSRSDDDLLRYHGKMMIVDRNLLFLLGYNFTRKDIEKSRSLGLVTDRPALVEEGLRLFESDFERRTYVPQLDDLVVSPLNSRVALLALIEGATERLLIYDSRLSDTLMQEAIMRRALAGVDVRIIGKAEKLTEPAQVQQYEGERLHGHAIVRDGSKVFIGSQGLRRAELERRREIGLIVSDAHIVRGVASRFERDWAAGDVNENGKEGRKLAAVG
jgi:cardiolipin synthase